MTDSVKINVGKIIYKSAVEHNLFELALLIQSEILNYIKMNPVGSYESGVKYVIGKVMRATRGHMNPVQVEWLVRQERASWENSSYESFIPC